MNFMKEMVNMTPSDITYFELNLWQSLCSNCVDALLPSQQFFSDVGTYLVFNQY